MVFLWGGGLCCAYVYQWHFFNSYVIKNQYLKIASMNCMERLQKAKISTSVNRFSKLSSSVEKKNRTTLARGYF